MLTQSSAKAPLPPYAGMRDHVPSIQSGHPSVRSLVSNPRPRGCPRPPSRHALTHADREVVSSKPYTGRANQWNPDASDIAPEPESEPEPEAKADKAKTEAEPKAKTETVAPFPKMAPS